jgi:hypothetical protein
LKRPGRCDARAVLTGLTAAAPGFQGRRANQGTVGRDGSTDVHACQSLTHGPCHSLRSQSSVCHATCERGSVEVTIPGAAEVNARID